MVDVTDKAVYDECFGAGIADAAIFRLSAGLKIVDAGGNEIADLADARSKAAVADVAAVYEVESTDVLTEFSAYLKSNGVKRATLASSSTAVCMLAADDSRIKVFYRVNDDVTDRDSAVDAIKKANLCGAQTIILGGKTTAETVKGIAESADAKAGNAETVAAGAVTTANGAKTKAEDAVSKAETAIETANGADTKADSATEVASAANTKSDNAVSAANEAKQTASDAANLASTTKTQVEQKVNDLEQQIGTKQGTTVTLNGTPQATFEGGGLIDENDTIIFSGGEA